MRFVVIIEKEPQSLYGGWFPDAPGAAAAGATFDECVMSARASLRVWAAETLASGGSLPEVRTLEAIQRDPDVRAARSRGAVVVVVPLNAWG